MSSRVPSKLRGSRGPFQGPSAKQITEFEDHIRADPSAVECGFSYDPAMHNAEGSRYAGGVMQPAANIAKFYELEPIQHKWRFVSAKAHLVTAATPCVLQCALYAIDEATTLRRIPGSLAEFHFLDAGTQEVSLDSEPTLYPGYTYFAGFVYFASGTLLWAGGVMALHPESLTHIFSQVTPSLGSVVDLAQTTLLEGPNGLSERCLISCKYITSAGKRLL